MSTARPAPLLTVIDHPLVQHKLSLLRDQGTDVRDFRELCRELSMLMAYEAMRDLTLEDATIETPVARADTRRLSGKKLALVAILRAGLVMVGKSRVGGRCGSRRRIPRARHRQCRTR